jgi:hypothetical protein
VWDLSTADPHSRVLEEVSSLWLHTHSTKTYITTLCCQGFKHERILHTDILTAVSVKHILTTDTLHVWRLCGDCRKQNSEMMSVHGAWWALLLNH